MEQLSQTFQHSCLAPPRCCNHGKSNVEAVGVLQTHDFLGPCPVPPPPLVYTALGKYRCYPLALPPVLESVALCAPHNLESVRGCWET